MAKGFFARMMLKVFEEASFEMGILAMKNLEEPKLCDWIDKVKENLE